ncbi:MAG: prepilin-type N-terminal cleavage/methylation domain-containing protein [Thermodesulfobacteriota bacterium]
MKYFFSWKKTGGFTLVEVMVTLTILGFVLLIIFGVFRLALSSWHKGEEIQEIDQQIRTVEQYLFRQIKSAQPYKVKSSKAEGDYLFFEGTAQMLKFISTYSLRYKRSEGLVLVIYDLRQQNGEGTLLLSEKRVLNKDLQEEVYDPEAAWPLLKNLKEAYFEYYQEEDKVKGANAEWVREWSGKERGQLPAAVRLRLKQDKEIEKGKSVQVDLVMCLRASRWEEIKALPQRRIIPQRPAG